MDMDWIIVDCVGSLALLDFVKLYQTEPDKYQRRFASKALEHMCDIITNNDEIMCMDEILLEKLVLKTVEMKQIFFDM